MTWEQRLRELLIASGALAAAACARSANDVSFDAQNVHPFCCNGSSDPCCLLDCYPDAAPSTACVEKRTCEADGGTWGHFSSGITQGCFPPDAAVADAEPFQDAAPNDAGAGSDGHE